MPNGDNAVLPTTNPGQGPGQDPQKMQQFMTLLSKLGPDVFKALAPKQQGLPQAEAPPQAAPPSQSAPPAIQTKADPMANVGSLPMPIAAPERSGPSSSSRDILSSIDPRGMSTYLGIQGVTQFLQESFQRHDQKQHAEAANAAQALMSALESAKTTGDYRPAEHILENNEALFNKVYKGWLQKAEEAKKEANKPKKAEKAPDPEVQGFEKGLATYMGSGAAKQPGQPQPPSTLQGKSGAKYFMPGAAPQQAAQQQQQSAELQASRQDPNRDLGSQMSSGEQRQAELGKAGLTVTPKLQADMNKYAVEYAKLDNERKKSEDDIKKAQLSYDTEVTKAGFASKESQIKLQEAQLGLQKTQVQLDIAKQRGQIELQKAKNGGQVPPGYRMRWQATTKAEEMLNKAVTEKRDLTPQERTSLTNLLGAAGAANLAKSVPGGGVMGGIGQAIGMSTKPDALLKAIQDYKGQLKKALSGSPSWLDESSDSTDDSQDDIVVDPKDIQ